LALCAPSRVPAPGLGFSIGHLLVYATPERCSPQSTGVKATDQTCAVLPSLTAGIEHQVSYDVTADMTPAHLPRAVLSTPSMIQLIEQTCLAAVQEHLDDGETTVGTHVCVSHTGPAAVGETVTVSCRLTGVERRRLTFDVEVQAPTQQISTGTHERAVIDLNRFAAT
jgi:fluoroacetyl-CoA thioesterase